MVPDCTFTHYAVNVHFYFSDFLKEVLTMSYVSEQLEKLKAKNSNEPEFIQAATEVLTSLEPVFEQNPKYEEAGILERITEPERVVMFRVPWVDDNERYRLTAVSVFSLTVLSVRIRAV